MYLSFFWFAFARNHACSLLVVMCGYVCVSGKPDIACHATMLVHCLVIQVAGLLCSRICDLVLLGIMCTFNILASCCSSLCSWPCSMCTTGLPSQFSGFRKQ